MGAHKNTHYPTIPVEPGDKSECLTQTTATSDVEYIEYESDLMITETEFEAIADFIAELLLRNYLQEEAGKVKETA